MMCNCNKNTLEVIDGVIKEQLEKGGKFEGYSSRWSNGIIRLNGKKGGDVMMNVEYEYQGFKVNGAEKKNKTKGSMFMAMTFCPFCGAEYNPKD